MNWFKSKAPEPDNVIRYDPVWEKSAKTCIGSSISRFIIVITHDGIGLDVSKYTPDKILTIRHFIFKSSMKRVNLELKRSPAIHYRFTMELLDGKCVQEDFCSEDANKLYNFVINAISDAKETIKDEHVKVVNSALPRALFSESTHTKITYPELHNIDVFSSTEFDRSSLNHSIPNAFDSMDADTKHLPKIASRLGSNSLCEFLPEVPDALPSYWEKKTLQIA